MSEPTGNVMFGRRLRKVREHRGLSLAQLAERTDYTKRQVLKWEQGQSEPRLTALARLATALATDLDWLIRGVPDDKAERAKQRVLNAIDRVVEEQRQEAA